MPESNAEQFRHLIRNFFTFSLVGMLEGRQKETDAAILATLASCFKGDGDVASRIRDAAPREWLEKVARFQDYAGSKRPPDGLLEAVSEDQIAVLLALAESHEFPLPPITQGLSAEAMAGYVYLLKSGDEGFADMYRELHGQLGKLFS